MSGLAVDQKDMQCSICLGVLNNPMSCSSIQCGNSFCHNCIEQWLKNSSSCPLCKNALSNITLIPNRTLNNLIKNCKVQCDLSSNDDEHPMKCDWTGRLSDLSSHMKGTCQFYEMKCRHQDCQHPYQRFQRDNHLSVCAFENEPCSVCNELIQRKNLDHHIKHTCSERIVSCPNDCYVNPFTKTKMAFYELGRHLVSCPFQLVDCPLYAMNSCASCNGKMKKCDLKFHLSSQSESMIAVLENSLKTANEMKSISNLLYHTQTPATNESLLKLIEIYENDNNITGLLAVLESYNTSMSIDIIVTVCHKISGYLYYGNDAETYRENSSKQCESLTKALSQFDINLPTAHAVKAICDTMVAICKTDSNNQNTLTNAGACGHLVTLYKSESRLYGVMASVCSAIHAISDNNHTICLKFMKHITIESLITVIKSAITVKCGAAVTAVCSVIKSFCFNMTIALQFCNAGVCEALVLALENSSILVIEVYPEMIKVEILNVYLAIQSCSRDVITANYFIEAGICKSLTRLLKRADKKNYDKESQEICETVIATCRDDLSIIKYAESGIFPILMETFRQSALNLKFVDSIPVICKSIHNFCLERNTTSNSSNTSSIQQFSDLGICEVLVNALKLSLLVEEDEFRVPEFNFDEFYMVICHTINCFIHANDENINNKIIIDHDKMLEFLHLCLIRPYVTNNSLHCMISIVNTICLCYNNSHSNSVITSYDIKTVVLDKCHNFMHLMTLSKSNHYNGVDALTSAIEIIHQLITAFGLDMKNHLYALNIYDLLQDIKNQFPDCVNIQSILEKIFHLFEGFNVEQKE